MKKSNTVSVGDAIKEYLKTRRFDSKLAEVEVISAWEKLMGPTIGKYTRDIRIKQGVLTLYLDSSIAKNELFMMREQIKCRLNEHVGIEVIKEVRIQ